MKKFSLKLLYFLLPAILLAYPLDYVISYYLSQSNTYPGEYEVWNDIYNSDANCDIAIYGSSRAWVHINPKILSDSLEGKVYNFGIDGHNFWLQYLRHLELLKHNEKPKTIILSVDIFSLRKRKDLYQLDQFLPFMLWNSNIKEYTISYNGYNKSDYNIPLIRYAGKIKPLKLTLKNLTKIQTSTGYREKGFLSMDREWNTDLEKAKKSRKSYVSKTDSSSVVLFEKFMSECKTNSIELILVYTPEHIDGQNFVVNRDEIVQIYKDFSKKYSVKFLDYSDHSLCLNKNYFYNASHLNSEGANIFSEKLASDLKARTHNNVYKK